MLYINGMKTPPIIFQTTAAMLAAILGIALPGPVGAQGFGLSEVGSCAVGRGFAVTGAPCDDASTIYWNPAAASRLNQGNSLLVGIAMIKVNGSFRQDTTNRLFKGAAPYEFPPHLFFSHRRGRMAAGIGIYVPYGLTSQWKEDFPGRFVALRASLQSIYFQPNISYQLTPNWSVGGGPVFAHSKVELQQGVDLSTQELMGLGSFSSFGIPPYTEFARAELKGSGTAWGFNLGIHGNLTPSLTVGGRFLSELKFKYKDADATFSPTPTGLVLPAPVGTLPAGPVDDLVAGFFSTVLADQKGSATIPHPWQAQVGIGYTGIPGTVISVDIARVGWASFKTLPINFEIAPSREIIEDYEDSWALRIGGEKTMTTQGTMDGWKLRGGLSFAQSPAPAETVTPLLPDMNRTNLSGGLEIPLRFRPGMTLDASYLYVATSGRRGRVDERDTRAQTAQMLNSGVYSLGAHVLSLSLNAKF